MREKFYIIFDLVTSEKLGIFCSTLFFIGNFLFIFIYAKKPIENYYDYLFPIIAVSPILFFMLWLILAIIVLGIEKLVIAPIEFIVYELGIPKIKINVDVIWKYQQRSKK